MMKRAITMAIAGLLLCFGATASQATTVLSEYALNINGTVYDNPYGNDPMLATGLNTIATNLNTTTGIGSITLNYSGANTYNIGAFFDHAILDNLLSFGSDYGSVSGASALAGTTWQIGDPWTSTIYNNFAGSSLDNGNAQSYAGTIDTYNVSMALARNFTLDSSHKAQLTFTVGQADPGGFYLKQTNVNTNESIYLSSTLDISDIPIPPGPGTNPVPEPSTLMLFGSALAGFGLYARKRKKS
jgi:hypothetical protein